MNAGGISTEAPKVQMKKIKVTVGDDPPVNILVPVLTCLSCQATKECYLNEFRRTAYGAPWKLQGLLPPQGWVDGKCPTCVAMVKAATEPSTETEEPATEVTSTSTPAPSGGPLGEDPFGVR